jgi:hypothetical protein
MALVQKLNKGVLDDLAGLFIKVLSDFSSLNHAALRAPWFNQVNGRASPWYQYF